jgi:hypothetical protein
MHPCRQAYSRFALCCARHMAALATITVILLAVVGKVAGGATEAGGRTGRIRRARPSRFAENLGICESPETKTNRL